MTPNSGTRSLRVGRIGPWSRGVGTFVALASLLLSALPPVAATAPPVPSAEQVKDLQMGATSPTTADAFASAPASIRERVSPVLSTQEPPLGGPLGRIAKEGRALADQAAGQVLAQSVVDQINGNAPATVAAAAADDQGKSAPQFEIHDFRASCDLNGDGLNDMLDTYFEDAYRNEGGTVTRGVSGDNGRTLWQHNNGPFIPGFQNYLPVPLVLIFPIQLPTGEYLKPPIWDTTESDINGSGACDALVLGVTGAEVILTTYINFVWIQVYWYLAVLEGKTGREIWHVDYTSDIILLFPRSPVCGDVVARFVNIPTGLDHFNTGVGPRYVLVMHDWTFTIVRYLCPVNNNAAIPYFITMTNVTVFNTTTNERIFNRVIDYETPNGLILNLLRGESDLMGTEEHGPEKEIMLDRFDVDTGDCTVKVLRGRDGGDFWETPYTNINPQSGQFPNGEEIREFLLWCLSYFVPDLTGDGVADVLGSVFTFVVGESNTFNSAFRTHYFPLYGHNGKSHWRKDIRNQGWGYMQGLDPRTGPRNDPVDFVGTGLTDFPSRAAQGGRFPAKHTHLNFLNFTSGAPTWFFEQDWAQSTSLLWDYSLYQFIGDGTQFPYGDFNGIAPADLTGDGLRDLLTPADYVQPRGPIQILLSTQTHKYHLYDGVTDELVSTGEAWSGNGISLRCGIQDGKMTVISGHSRRVDLTRFDLATGQVEWRQPLYNDSMIRAQTAGSETIFMIPSCKVTPDGRTMFGFNLGVFSLKRGLENVALHGYMQDEGFLYWVLPELNGRPPLTSSLKIDFLLFEEPPQPSTAERMFIAFTPAVPGMAVGLGVASSVGRVLRKRRSHK